MAVEPWGTVPWLPCSWVLARHSCLSFLLLVRVNSSLSCSARVTIGSTAPSPDEGAPGLQPQDFRSSVLGKEPSRITWVRGQTWLSKGT